IHTESAEEFLRKATLGLALVAFSGAMLLVAQPPRPRNPIEEVLHPRAHMRPASPNAPSPPGVVFDATGLGSPLTLDKGWRVGISGNPAIAAPDFDDSTWPTRHAEYSFAEVPDEDHPAGLPTLNPNAPHPHPHQRPFAWYRLHIKLAPNHGPVALFIELPV